MPRLNLAYDSDHYRSPVTWLYCGWTCLVRLVHKPGHKRETKSAAYREVFYHWLRASDDYNGPPVYDDYLCQALGEVLTRQEWRYFKQAYYLAHRHVALEVGPWAALGSSVVANFSRVRKAYEEALQARRANCPSC